MVLDFLKRLYAKRQQSADPVLRRAYQIAERARTDPTISGARKTVHEGLGVPEQDFDTRFTAYWLAMEASGKSCNWNAEDEPLMRSAGLREEMIIAARTDFTTAVLARVFLWIVMDGKARAHVLKQARRSSAPERTEPQPLRADHPGPQDEASAPRSGKSTLANPNRLLNAVEGALKAMADEAIRKSRAPASHRGNKS